jgi:hypothetical protein
LCHAPLPEKHDSAIIGLFILSSQSPRLMA